MRDPYECLAVARTATAEEITKSFRQLAKQLHPDANSDPKCNALFVELNAAYKILSNEEKRRAFDRGEIDRTGALVLAAPRARRRRSMFFLLAAVFMLAGISAALVNRLTAQGEISATNDGSDEAIARPAAAISRSADSEKPADGEWNNQANASGEPVPRLILQENDSYASGDTIPLGLQISGEAAGLAVEITGLPPGTTLSAGREMGEGGWRLVAANVGNAMIHPPAGFSGALEFNVELRLADDTVIDHGSFRLDWTPVAAAVETGTVSDTSSHVAMVNASPNEQHPTQRAAQPRRIDREQVELLIGRSQKLMTEGDVQAARTLLQRAAEARDARAALCLGATFDPIMLAILQARGIVPDVEQARYWYKKASEFGSEEADQRLRLLAPAKSDEVSQVELGHVRASRFWPRRTASKTAAE
jgi:curved DNA-binding protein CbpA